ncbi:Methyltransferase type 11 [Thioalkalivibrio sulfidiphilus HL-EbGr7]|uniref:Methyltransferase type 11 n=1 Tax=Thioalkalivibrio sulfidiphilus (strain HL-EbGR7) TaxID=396588 RepID=B8GV84_THISH|nr:class I SAM-dependent methyltransferase [Thioalkalivibrio sulfidiphilus]ACL73430.1 Methyltransferase type 11 [Thioalkalivibrio sulfidiphilus HL-EbGr7]
MDTEASTQPSTLSRSRSSIREALLNTQWGFDAYMRLRWGGTRRDWPSTGRINRALMSQEEVSQSVAEANSLKLPPCEDAPKTWDTLAALRAVLEATTTDAVVLDAGAETYSRFLPWLYLYGYRNLHGINLVFDKPFRQGSIQFENGDITRTRFPDGHFDAIACLSVVEHGVDLEAYFREMSRILKPGGVLITSTDYFETPTDTQGLTAYGAPIHVFDRDEILQGVEIAKGYGLGLTSDLDLRCQDKVVRWHPYEHQYTFISIGMKKTGSA